MTYEQYWDGKPILARSYLKAYELKEQRKNREMWYQGMYNYSAFSSVIGNFSYGLGGRKGKRPDPYLEYPLANNKLEIEAEKQRKIEHTLKFFREGQK